MPVEIVVVSVSLLFVSSGSKIALFGSTVTSFVIWPTVGGATTRKSTNRVSAAGMIPPEQVTTFVPWSHEQSKPPSVA